MTVQDAFIHEIPTSCVRLVGSMTALITPMTDDGAVSFDAFGQLIEAQIAGGTDVLVPAGTTGESPTLSHDEHGRVVAFAVERSNGRVPVMAGAGSNSTREAVELARHAAAVGANAVLVVAPYYNKPTQEGLYRHFMMVADATDLPLFVYNIPGRSVVDVSNETIARLARHPNIVGVKDATANLARPLQLRQMIGAGFVQLSGDDATTLPYLAAGGHGCISVTSNLAPATCARMHRAWREGRFGDALALHLRLMPLHETLFCEASPGPVKYLARRLGIGTSALRLPLVEPKDASCALLDAALQAAGLPE